MMTNNGDKARELATIQLTAEQRAKIAEVTGVDLTEISVLKHVGQRAREVNPSLLDATMVVACW